MRLNVRVVPNAKKNQVRRQDNNFRVYLNAPAQDNKANKLLINLLAEYFKTKKSQVSIVRGGKSRDKIIEIL